MGDCNTLKSFSNQRHCDPHLDQTKLNGLLLLTIHGVLKERLGQTNDKTEGYIACEVQKLCHGLHSFGTLQQEIKTDDDHAAMRESF